MNFDTIVGLAISSLVSWLTTLKPLLYFVGHLAALLMLRLLCGRNLKKPSLSSRAAGERGGSEGSMQNLGTFVLGVDFLWF